METSPAIQISNERDFFDQEAAQLSQDDLLAPSQSAIERYRHARLQSSGNMAKEAMFAILSPLEGKSVLDYGCGHGENACLLAACGASVTAFDLSPGSIEQARKRAALHHLEDRIRFDVRRAGETEYPDSSFDIVTGFAILHHVHTMLPTVFAEIRRLLNPGGMAVFIEPVANSALLRVLRKLTPVPTSATPDERQLRYGDFEPLNDGFMQVQMHHFHCLARLRRLTGGWGIRTLATVDSRLQYICPWLRKYYGMVVVSARRSAER